jgi:hypothetical protein
MRLNVPNYFFVNDRCADPGDPELGTWTPEQLKTMNARFTERLERAFACGLENRESARRQVKLPASLRPRFVTALCDGLLRSAAGGETVFVAR